MSLTGPGQRVDAYQPPLCGGLLDSAGAMAFQRGSDTALLSLWKGTGVTATLDEPVDASEVRPAKLCQLTDACGITPAEPCAI